MNFIITPTTLGLIMAFVRPCSLYHTYPFWLVVNLTITIITIIIIIIVFFTYYILRGVVVAVVGCDVMKMMVVVTMVSWCCCCCCCYHCHCCCCINYVHLLSLGAVVCLLPRNNADTGGFSRDPLQAGQLSARLKHHLLHLQHGGPG